MNTPNRRFDSCAARARILMVGLAACGAAPVMAAGDFVYGDDFESTFVCPAGPLPAITGAMSPASINTSLGTQSRYLVKVFSCGFSGNVALTPSGAPASWTLAIDPPNLSVALNSAAVAELTVTVPTDGDAGLVSIHVDAAASGANTAPLSADLDVANEYAIHFAPDGTGAGPHAFLPAFLQIKVGATLRFISDDSTDVHNIHAEAPGAGFIHQSPATVLMQGQEYDITATATVTNTAVYCHIHPAEGTMHVTVVP